MLRQSLLEPEQLGHPMVTAGGVDTIYCDCMARDERSIFREQERSNRCDLLRTPIRCSSCSWTRSSAASFIASEPKIDSVIGVPNSSPGILLAGYLHQEPRLERRRYAYFRGDAHTSTVGTLLSDRGRRVHGSRTVVRTDKTQRPQKGLPSPERQPVRLSIMGS